MDLSHSTNVLTHMLYLRAGRGGGVMPEEEGGGLVEEGMEVCE